MGKGRTKFLNELKNYSCGENKIKQTKMICNTYIYICKVCWQIGSKWLLQGTHNIVEPEAPTDYPSWACKPDTRAFHGKRFILAFTKKVRRQKHPWYVCNCRCICELRLDTYNIMLTKLTKYSTIKVFDCTWISYIYQTWMRTNDASKISPMSVLWGI